MKTSRFSETQILAILRQAEGGVPVPELCREHGMSTASFYKWRSKYGGMDASMIVAARLSPPADHRRDVVRPVFNDVVSDVSYAGIAMRVEILGQERRRRWRDEEKLEIVMSVGVSGATITEIAQRHGVTRQQIYTWRRELKKKGLLSASSNALFIPVDMNALQTDALEDGGCPSGMIELRLICGRTLRFGDIVDARALTQLIRAVEAA